MKTYLAIICAILALFLLAGCASTAASPANIDAAEISSVPPAEVKLDQLSAKTEALADAGLRESEVSDLRTEYEVDDGVPQYEVDFRSGDTEYSYTIHAETGAILEKDQDHEPVKQPQPTEAPKVTEPPATEAPKETQPAEEKISASKAKSIALNHAGVSSDDARGMECEYDADDGVKLYEVSFRSGKYEYDYEINALTGKIISWDKEIDD